MKAIHNKDYSVVKTLKTGFFGISFSFVLFGGHYKKKRLDVGSNPLVAPILTTGLFILSDIS